MQRHILASTIALALTASAPAANAVLQVGAQPASFTVKDVNDRDYPMSSLTGGAPALLLYVDKSGATQNKHLEGRLEKLRAEEPLLRAVRFVPIVDLSMYNSWPKRGFAKSTLRDEQRGYPFTLYADWDGAGHARLATTPRVSNLIVLDRMGHVAWASAGQLSTAQEDALIQRLREAAR